MGRHSCCLKQKLRQGLWSPEEDEKLYNYMNRYGTKGCWSSVPKLAELQRCGKSCRLRWLNYLRPDLKRGTFSQDEEDLIINLHKLLGNRWAQIAAQLPGRTDNEIKNFWNSNLKKKLMKQGINPVTHKPLSVENPKKLEEKNPINESPQEQLLIRSNKAPLHSTSILRENEPRFLLFDAYSANDNGLMEASREIHGSAFDCVPLLEFQTSFGSNFYNQNLTSQYHPDSRFEMNPSFEFSSLPCLTSLDNLEFSGNSGSRLMSSSNSSTINNYNAAFDCLFQFQEVKSEDFEPNSSSWKDQEQQIYAHNSIDFSSYPFTSLSEDLTQTSFEVVFDHIELSPPPPCI